MEVQFPNPRRIFVLCYSSCLVDRLSPLTSLIYCHGKELQMADLLLSQAVDFSPETFLLIQSGHRKESGRVLHHKRVMQKKPQGSESDKQNTVPLPTTLIYKVRIPRCCTSLWLLALDIFSSLFRYLYCK